MFHPLFFMVLLTFGAACAAIKNRFFSVKNESISLKYFQPMQGENIPLAVTKTTRCFNNLFEIRVIFYVVGSLYISLQIDSMFAIIFAWIFVIARLIQATVNITYNNVIDRMLAFWLSVLSVFVLWINLLVHNM
jgi:hypothetical protein